MFMKLFHGLRACWICHMSEAAGVVLATNKINLQLPGHLHPLCGLCLVWVLPAESLPWETELKGRPGHFASAKPEPSDSSLCFPGVR